MMKMKPRRKTTTIQRLRRDEIAQAGNVRFANRTETQEKSEKWIRAKNRSFPITHIFASRKNNHITGYIIWEELDGFHPKATFKILEVETLPEYHGKGLRARLVRESKTLIKKYLRKVGRRLGTIMAFVDSGDKSLTHLYEKVLLAKAITAIEEIFGDVTVLVAHEIPPDELL